MRVLVAAPHADDETLGVGGTIARLAGEGHEVVVCVFTGHGVAPHPLGPESLWTQVRSEAKRAHRILGVAETIYREVPAVFVADQSVYELNEVTSQVMKEVKPDVLYAPFPLDLHKDHRELFHSLSITWRPFTETGRRLRQVLCYEVPSETHLNIPYVEQAFTPNVWMNISSTLDKKLEALECFQSQLHAPPDLRSLETVRALARWRGAQMGVEAAEAFVLVRQVG